MTDIVYKLRHPAWLWSQDGGSQLDKTETLIDMADAADEIERLRTAQTESLSGCLHPGKEPLSCQYEGKCLSLACNHNGKTWYGPRMTLEAQVDGIKYPSFAERNLIDRFGPKETK